MTDIAANDTVTISKADQKAANIAAHEQRLATAKAEGEARRAQIAADKKAKHEALLASQKALGASNRDARIAAHEDRNAKAKKPANDVAADVDQAA